MSRPNRFLSRPNRLWCAFLVLVLLLQGMAMHAAAAATPVWTEVCSAAGTKYVPATLAEDPDSQGSAHANAEHCAECVVSAPLAALWASPAWWFDTGPSDPGPAGGTIDLSLPSAAWSPLQARAPPSFA